MAQKYNPSTGQWEDEEEDDGSLASGTAAAFGGGSAPALDGSSMSYNGPSLGGTPQTQPGMFTMPSGASWGDENYLTSQGISKKYANPWDTKYSYMKGDQDLGFGYDSYQDAIKKLAFTSGISYQNPIEATSGWGEGGGFNTPGTPGGYRHSAYATDGAEWNQPGTLGQVFDSKQALWDFMNSDPTGKDALSYDSREKYGRALSEGQLQNMYSMYAGGHLSGPVADWNSGRMAYHNPDNINGVDLSGDAALVGTRTLFGADGKPLGYGANINPTHIRGADTSGRVKSSSYGGTYYNPDMTNILRGIDENNAFINAADASKYGYTSSGNSTYSKEKNFMDKYMPSAIIALSMAGLGGALGGAGWATGAAEGATAGAGAAGGLDIGALLGESAGAGFSPALGLGYSPLSSLGSMAEIGGGLGGLGAGLSSLGEMAGVGGLGLEGLPGMVSDLGSLFGETIGQGFTPASGLEFNPTSSIGSTGIGAGQGGLGFASELGVNMDLGSVFAPAAEALSNSPEIMGPPEVSEMPGQFVDDWGGGTNGMGEFTNGKGMLSPQDRIATAMRSLGMERDLAANLTQGGSKMYNFMTQSPGKAGMFKAPSPLEMLYKGGKAFMDYRSNKDAMGMYEDQLNKVRSYQDPNRARGDFANKQWQQGISDPMAGYQDFMMGGGRQFIDQARAQAAKGGKRGSYINSGKMNSDLASLYMKNQIERQNMLKGGFASSPNNEETTMKYMGPLMDMERNKYAPFGQAIDSVMRGFQLSDLFGG